jgi:alpha/beta superfamily hydrolase
LSERDRVLDETLLRSLSRRSDPVSGIVERFIQPTIGGGSTVAVLSEPAGPGRSTGFVICPAFGLEQTYLGRLDVQVARTLSAAGFPVLRYHGQGYGDSEGTDHVGLASHLADATDAVRVLAEEPGIRDVGVVGARLGGTVAALVADRLRLPLAVLIAPVTDGRKYMRQFVWSLVIADWTARTRVDPASRAETQDGKDGAGKSDETTTLQDTFAQLKEQGWADIQGFRLTQRSRREIEGVSLVRDVGAFSGAALVLSLSRTGEPRPEVQALARRLEELGADVTVQGLVDPTAGAFGRYNFRRSGATMSDTLADLRPRLAEDTTSWCVARSPSEASRT